MKTLIQPTVTLRPIEPSDFDILKAWENDPSNWNYGDQEEPYTDDELYDYLAQSDLSLEEAEQFRWVILDKETDQRIGFIDLFDYHHKHQRAGLGIIIGDKSFRGKGFAKAAIQDLLTVAFSQLNLHQVYCHVSTNNPENIALFEKSGFELAGELKSWHNTDHGFEDVRIYQRLSPNA